MMRTPQKGQLLPKLAGDPARYLRPTFYFPSARAAFAAYLRAEGVGPEDTVLLPAYIGWSSREGSGVFDPISEVGCKYAFYRMDRGLRIDLDHVAAQLRIHRPRVVVVIHYFGYPDPRLATFVDLARQSGAHILEDEAHALFTDWVGGLTGRYGDAAIASLHKLLPIPDGGLLILNRADHQEIEKVASKSARASDYRLIEYDCWTIAATRRRNAETLAALLAPLAGQVDLLFPALPLGVSPQTLPVLIRRASRDQLYFDLNAAGFGVVSLYHTLVDAISPSEFPDSHWLAKRILNLPVHQDVDPSLFQPLILSLAQLLRRAEPL